MMPRQDAEWTDVGAGTWQLPSFNIGGLNGKDVFQPAMPFAATAASVMVHTADRQANNATNTPSSAQPNPNNTQAAGSSMYPRKPSLFNCLLAGGIAGLAVDMSLFPLDTLKTRLQSKAGFMASGGFKGMYLGVSSAAVGSAPGAALFFFTYETMKRVLSYVAPSDTHAPFVHMGAAVVGEVSACTIRVPTEVIKQRMQAKQYHTTTVAIRMLYHTEGVLGFYTGFRSTVLREIPFTCIQFPLYEYLKSIKSQYSGHSVSSADAAICGSIAGGIAAGLTTPFDVVKTRIMLSSPQSAARYTGVWQTMRTVLREEGAARLFSGVYPRTAWISLGGAVFFGVYEYSLSVLEAGRQANLRRGSSA